MMQRIYLRSVPFCKDDAILALEAGVDGILTEESGMGAAARLALCDIRPDSSLPVLRLERKEDESAAAARLAAGESLALARGWEVIPVENLLAGSGGHAPAGALGLAVEAGNLDEARLALGILERGVPTLVLLPEALPEVRDIVALAKTAQASLPLRKARVTSILPVGLGHRVCVDTLSLLRRGQGMLIGNSSAFTFLVHAETERNEYVAARPFRINAGGINSYALLPGGRTCYLEELRPCDEILIMDANGSASRAVAGRLKIEVRPMLYVEAEADGPDGPVSGGIFLQNAETVRLTGEDRSPLSVVDLRPGHEVICRLEQAGRHCGMSIAETIQESGNREN
jgi:3-dehydroquinate synthase II